MICLSATCNQWIEQGIASSDGFGGIELTHELREWMLQNVGSYFGNNKWWWDHFPDEREVEMWFANEHLATLFKLTWG